MFFNRSVRDVRNSFLSHGFFSKLYEKINKKYDVSRQQILNSEK